MSTHSIWQAGADDVAMPPLSGDLQTEVAIVGGGITGVLCAQLLHERGIPCVLLEARRIGLGTTGNSTGNLYAMPGRHEGKLSDDALAARVWQVRAAAVDRIEALVREGGLDCDFARRPWVLFSEKEARHEGFEHVRRVAPLAGLSVRDGAGEIPFPVKTAIAIDNQAQFNPLAFVRQLARRLPPGVVFEHSAVTEIEDGPPAKLVTASGSVTARWLILATHTPKGALKVHTAMAPYREYAIAAPLTDRKLPQAIAWSVEMPRHSLRSYSVGGQPHLVVLGESHKTGQETDTGAFYDSVLAWARSHFGVEQAAYTWSAQNYRPADGLPMIGASGIGDHVLYASGFAADGLTWAAVAAPILAARIAGTEAPEAKLFDSGRFTPLASAKNFLKETANVLEQYLKDVPGHADADTFGQVRRGFGKTIERGGEKLAVYRDEAGGLHVCSAVCTHMQCIVAWNKAEKSWDCPCHGSRFDVDGRVLEGPALVDLPPAKA